MSWYKGGLGSIKEAMKAGNGALKFGLEKFGDLDQPYMLTFSAHNYSNKQSIRGTDMQGALINIHLPMPMNLSVNNNITYESGQTETTGGLFDPTVAGVGESLKSWLTGGSWWKDMSGYSALMGKRPMDERDSIFRGADFRSHNYSWVLIPKSKEEAIAVKDIAQAFQRGGYPKKTGLETYSRIIHPPVWKIDAISAGGPGGFIKEAWHMNPLPSVLAKCSVQTSGVAGGMYTKGGLPAATKIDVGFVELEPAINNGEKLVSRSQLRMGK
jgi:hypothetical protein